MATIASGCEIGLSAPGRLTWRAWPAAILCLWGSGVVGAFLWVVAYDLKPSAPTAPPRQWPQASALDRSSRGPTLIMFVHPHCPCTMASLDELQRIAERYASSVKIDIVVVQPADLKGRVRESRSWKAAAGIKSANLQLDRDGAEARLFAAATSGFTVLYDQHGKLIFSGGLTGARGHYGANPNSAAAVAAIAQHSEENSAPVFGCDLFTPGACCLTPTKHNETSR